MTATIGSLFSGYGGLDMGVQLVLEAEPIWHSDVKPASVKLLRHRYPDVPNLGDLTKVDWRAIRQPDILTGGFPCTDISLAGRGLGLIRSGDDRTRSGLWAEMCRAIDILRPSLVVAENVRAITSAKADSDVEPCPTCVGDGPDSHMRALGAVLADLADIGYDAAWCGLPASDVGAPHARFRIFIVAWPVEDAHGAARGQRRLATSRQAQGGGSRPDAGGSGGVLAADTNGAGLEVRNCVASDPRTKCSSTERGGSVADESATADPEGDGWSEGRSEPARQLRGPNHAVSSAPAATYPDDDGRERIWWELAEQRDADRRRGADRAWGETEPEADADAARYSRWLRNRDNVLAGQPDTERAAATNSDRDAIRLEPVPESGRSGASVAGDDVQWGSYGPAIERWAAVLGRPAPAPTETGPKGGQRLSPRLTEWMMGLPEGWITDLYQPPFWFDPRFTPLLSRSEALSLCGDGVVPQQAAEALRRLLPVVAAERAA